MRLPDDGLGIIRTTIRTTFKKDLDGRSSTSGARLVFIISSNYQVIYEQLANRPVAQRFQSEANSFKSGAKGCKAAEEPKKQQGQLHKRLQVHLYGGARIPQLESLEDFRVQHPERSEPGLLPLRVLLAAFDLKDHVRAPGIDIIHIINMFHLRNRQQAVQTNGL